MRKAMVGVCFLLVAGVLAAMPQGAQAQGSFELLTGKAFDSAFPKDFYLEGNAIPTEKRNGALLKTPAGARLLLALIDTTGYSSQIKQKYIGMVINEGQVSICGASVGVGSYGFGLDRPAPTSKDDAKFHLYNQAGAEVASCAAPLDAAMKMAKPLQVSVGKGGPATLELGKYKVEIK